MMMRGLSWYWHMATCYQLRRGLKGGSKSVKVWVYRRLVEYMTSCALPSTDFWQKNQTQFQPMPSLKQCIGHCWYRTEATHPRKALRTGHCLYYPGSCAFLALYLLCLLRFASNSVDTPRIYIKLVLTHSGLLGFWEEPFISFDVLFINYLCFTNNRVLMYV